MTILFGRSKRLLVCTSTIALIVVATLLFYFDLDLKFLQSEQYFNTGFRKNTLVEQSYNVKSEFQTMIEIVKTRNDLCSSMSKLPTSSTKKQDKRECTRSCSQIVMDEALQRQKINLTHNLINMNNFDLFTELLPDFPCFPFSGCRCPAPECILEKRTDAFAENFRQNRKILTEKRNEIRLQFHYYDQHVRNRNISTIYEQFTTNDEKKFLETNSEKFRAIHDEYLCVQNPFYEHQQTKISSKSNKFDDHAENDDAVDELHCRNPNRENDKNGDSLPMPEKKEIHKNAIIDTNHNKTENFERLAMKNVNRFKRRTSWGFSRWYDWKISNGENNGKFQFVFPNNNNDDDKPRPTRKLISANKKEEQEPEIDSPDGTSENITEQNNKNNNDDEDEKLRISGGYDHDGIYRIKNVCITPEGKPFGYFGPKDEMENEFRPFHNSVSGLKGASPVKPFHGSSEVGRLASKINDVVQDWISHDPTTNARSTRKKYSPLDDGMLSLLNFGQLPFPPPFFVDGKFMLMGVDWKSDNPGHALYRFIAARNIAKKVWGMPSSSSSSSNESKTKNQRTTGHKIERELAHEYLQSNNKSKYDNASYEDFHVIYLIEPNSDSGQKTLAGYKYFYDLLGSSWSTILNRPAESPHERSKFFSSKFLKNLKFSPQLSQEQKAKMYHEEFLEHDDQKDEEGEDENNNNDSEKQHQNFIKSFFQSSMVCFKEIVVAHTCGTKSCSLEKQFPSNGYHVPYVQTMSNSQKIFLRYFRLVFIDRCLSTGKNHDNYEKSTSSTIKTKVTLLVRKTSRVDLGLASAIPAISARLKSLSNSSSSFQLRIVSQQDLTPKQFLSIIHHETDILIGSMGGSLSYSWLLKNSDDDNHDVDRDKSENSQHKLVLLSSLFPSPSSSVIAEISGLRSCAFIPFDKNYRRSNFLTKNNSMELYFHDPKKAQGWNLHVHCDFGAMAQTVGTQHLSISIPKFSTKGIWRGKREKNIDLAVAEENFIFRVGGGRNQNNSWMQTLLRRQNQKLTSRNDTSVLPMIHFVANEILAELNDIKSGSRFELKNNITNETQIQYDHLFTEEMSVLTKNIQTVSIPSIMISSSSLRDESGDVEIIDDIASTTNTTTFYAKKKTNNSNPSKQGENDKRLQRQVPIPNPRRRVKDKVKSRMYPLGFNTPVTYIGTDLYLQILESCLCRHFEINAIMSERMKNNSSKMITTRSDIENFLDEKCPWRPKEAKYAKLKWGVDS